jgi:hypothetical protein
MGLAELGDLVEKIENKPMRRVLQSLMAGAPDLPSVHRRIEHYFDTAMERVRGWYARWAQLIAFAVAIGIVVSLNADTLMMADLIWKDSALRTEIVRLAEQAVQRRAANETLDQSTLTTSTNPGDPKAPGGSKATTTDLKDHKALGGYAEQLAAFPLGWATIKNDPRALPTSVGDICRKVIGLLVTALAVSLGAPFWFDLINHFVTLRSSGEPPSIAKAKSNNGTAKDKT